MINSDLNSVKERATSSATKGAIMNNSNLPVQNPVATPEPKVVVHVVQHLRPGGIECLALEMLKHSHDEIHIVSLEGNAAESLAHWPRLKEYSSRLYFLNKYSGWRPSVVKQLKEIFSALKAEVIHTHHIGPLIYAGTAARLARVKHRIHTEHDAWHLTGLKRRLLEFLALQWARPHLVADAKLVAENVQNAGLRYPVTVIENGIDSQHFSPGDQAEALDALGLNKLLGRTRESAKQSGGSLQIIGAAGRLVAEKGYRVLIDSMKELPESVVLLIAGEGPLKDELTQQIQTHNLEQRVFLLGNLSDMLPFYQAIDLFVLASNKEGLPLSPLEAQACNKPVVLTDVGACKEACCEESGLLVPANDSQALSWAIRRQLRQLAPDNETFSPRKFVEEHRDIRQMILAYQQLLESE